MGEGVGGGGEESGIFTKSFLLCINNIILSSRLNSVYKYIIVYLLKKLVSPMGGCGMYCSRESKGVGSQTGLGLNLSSALTSCVIGNKSLSLSIITFQYRSSNTHRGNIKIK